MDHTGGMLAAFAAVAALSARQRTGLGQHVDVSVRDLAASFIGPELLDVAMNSREPHRMGNRDESAAPQGVYRCRGEDEWVSISVASEAEWRGFVTAVGSPSWATSDEFGDAFRRWRRHDELDALIEEWTVQHTAEEATRKLQACGVAAHPSLAPDAMMQDRHLRARDAFPHRVQRRHRRAATGRDPTLALLRDPGPHRRMDSDPGTAQPGRVFRHPGPPADEVRELEQAQVIW